MAVIKGEGLQALNNIGRRVIIKDAKGGIRVDGLDIESGEIRQYIEYVAKTAKTHVEKKKKRAVEEVSGPEATKIFFEELRNPENLLKV